MNIATLRKLKNNPFYKMNSKQKEGMAMIERKPMVEFGSPDIHDNSLDIHPVNVVKINRKSKKDEKKQAK